MEKREAVCIALCFWAVNVTCASQSPSPRVGQDGWQGLELGISNPSDWLGFNKSPGG